VGDILEIVTKQDDNWWQARREGEKRTAGLIPTPKLQESRLTSIASEMTDENDGNVKCLWPSRKKTQKPRKTGRRGSKDTYVARYNTAFDQLELITYEEVSLTTNYKRKTLVLIGECETLELAGRLFFFLL
jgi:calcium/calmodulin-dependent serine protein kinase